MNHLQRRIGAGLGVLAYVVAVTAGVLGGVSPATVLLRAVVAGAGGYVLGRILGHVVLQAFLDDLAEAKGRQGDGSRENA